MGSQNCLFGGRWEPLRYRFIHPCIAVLNDSSCRTFNMGSENDGPWKKHFNSQHVYVGCPAVNFPDRNMETWKRSFPLNITIRLRLLKVELCAKTLWYHDICGFVFGLLFHPFFCQEIHHHPIGNQHISPEEKKHLKKTFKTKYVNYLEGTIQELIFLNMTETTSNHWQVISWLVNQPNLLDVRSQKSRFNKALLRETSG